MRRPSFFPGIRSRKRIPMITPTPDAVDVVTTGGATAVLQSASNALLTMIAANQDTQQTTLDSIDAALLELVDFARGGFEPSEPTLPFLVGAS